DQFPSGLFQTSDGGNTWQHQPGPRASSWLGAELRDDRNGLLAGAWGRLAMLRQGRVVHADWEAAGARSMHALAQAGQRAFAGGQGGLALTSGDDGAHWSYASLPYPTDLQNNCDFHAVAARGADVWVAGRPGSVVLHSADSGANWEILQTGQTIPLNGLFFL